MNNYLILDEILKKYFVNQQNQYFIDREDSNKFLIRQESEYFEEQFVLRISKKLTSNHLKIRIKDSRPRLSFFTNFNSEDNEKNTFTLIFLNSSRSLKQLDLYLHNYFRYRDIILDIKKIEGVRQDEQFHHFMSLTKRMKKEKNKKKILEIINFPKLDRETIEKYLIKFNKLLNLLTSDIDFIANISFYDPIPFNSVFYKIVTVRTIISMFDIIFINVDDFSRLIYEKEDKKIDFVISYLHYYNLIDDFYISIQKSLLKTVY